MGVNAVGARQTLGWLTGTATGLLTLTFALLVVWASAPDLPAALALPVAAALWTMLAWGIAQSVDRWDIPPSLTTPARGLVLVAWLVPVASQVAVLLA